jgi:two-component system, NtrC family, sensor kinase
MMLAPISMMSTLSSLAGISLTSGLIGLASAGSGKSGGKPELAVLQKISSLINRSSDLKMILESALEEIMNLIGVEAGAFRLAESSDVPSALVICRGFSKHVVSILEDAHKSSAALHASERHKALVVDYSLESGEADSWLKVLKKEGLHTFMLQPVRSGNRVLGTIELASAKRKHPKELQMDFLHTMAEILAVAILAAHSREQSGKLSEDLVALQEVNKIISQSFDQEDIIRRIVAEGKRLVKTSQCHLLLLDDRSHCLVGSASTQLDNTEVRKLQIPLSDPSIAITALTEKRVILVEDTGRKNETHQSATLALPWHAAIYAPILTKEQALGVLICSDDSPEHSFTQEQIFRSETLAHQASIALENARLFQVVSRSQKEWETTFDAMLDCVSVHDPNGKVIRANAALARRLKTIPQKIIGKYCSELYNPSGSDSIPCRHFSSMQSEALIVEEVELPEMGGTFQISVSPWLDKNNRLAGSIHVAKDISNEKLLQQKLIQSEKLSAIGELISGVAHELNNPLTGVMGYSQLLQLRNDLDERAKDSLLKINNLALRCQRIVQNLLSFARKQKPERTLIDLNEIIERTIELRNYELQVNNIEIRRDLDHNMAKTIADGHQLQQVFLNVITNAEQAMLEAHRSGRLLIRSRADRQSNRITVEIIDNGPGIPESHLTKIFDPFFTTKEVGKGTGLGLSLSYGIIKEHGGNIYVSSRLGEGSTFVIELPIIVPSSEGSFLPPELTPQALHFENLVREKRILVVDDEKYILDFFVEVFEMFPIQVDTAGDGRAAMEKMRVNDYDLIITDFKMPHMSGKELYEWIKDNRPSLAERIIFVTGDTVSPETRSFFEENRNRFLAKPFKIEDVKEAIQQTLEATATN